MIERLRLSVTLSEDELKGSFEDVELGELASDVISSLQENYQNRNIVLKVSRQITFINCDVVLFSIALNNLIENAIKYSSGDIIVKIEKDAIVVIDEGIGVSSEDIERITKKFFRVTKNSWHNSLGLGLFLVGKILRLHDFTLEIKSEEKVGSEFKIIIKQ
jgi:signal transduction histidine kinase